MRTQEPQLQYHLATAPRIVGDLVVPIVDDGGNAGEVLTVLETVVLGTLTTLAKLVPEKDDTIGGLRHE